VTISAGFGPATCEHRECAHPEAERVFTPATIITFVRTAATVVVGLLGAVNESLPLLLTALVIYWVGDSIDGIVARIMNHETRMGATLDIMCDRFSAAIFYIGYAWYEPSMILPVGIYLAEFMVIDMFLSLAFLAWPVSSPNYFYLIDRRLYQWNWSRIGKTANSGAFAVFMVVTKEPIIAGAIAAALFTLKAVSLGWLMKLGLPVPTGCLKPDTGPGTQPAV
jgi:CDP-diacylglycerol--glycerol-3-phosphate 3-phosphatidyltransferase